MDPAISMRRQEVLNPRFHDGKATCLMIYAQLLVGHLSLSDLFRYGVEYQARQRIPIPTPKRFGQAFGPPSASVDHCAAITAHE